MTLTCHNCKKTGHKKKDGKELIGKSDKPSNAENGTRKEWCSYLYSNRHSNEDCDQQQQSGGGWCTYPNSATHSDDQCYHQRHGSRNSSADDGKSTKDETFVAASNVTGCAVTEKLKEKPLKTTNRTIHRLA